VEGDEFSGHDLKKTTMTSSAARERSDSDDWQELLFSLLPPGSACEEESRGFGEESLGMSSDGGGSWEGGFGLLSSEELQNMKWGPEGEEEEWGEFV
jgi:hypothetical protein